MPSRSVPLRPSAWEWAQVGLLVVNVWWTTLNFGGSPAASMVVSSMLTGATLFLHLCARARVYGPYPRQNPSPGNAASDAAPLEEPGPFRRLHPAGLWLLPFLVYAAINAAWLSPVRWLGWDDWLRWAQMVAIFWVVLNGVRTRTGRRVLLSSLLVLGATAALMAGYQHVIDPAWLMWGRRQADQFLGRAAGPFGNPNNLAALVLLLLPFAFSLTLQRHRSAFMRVAFGALSGALLLALIFTVSRGAWIGLMLALSVCPLFNARRHWLWRVSAAIGCLAFCAAVVVTLYASVPLVRERLDQLVTNVGEKSRPIMWRVAWELFQEHPITGSGAGSYNVLFEKFRPETFQPEPHWTHNDYLNTLSDYGTVGAVLFFGACAAIAWSCRRAARRDPEKRVVDLELARALSVGLLAFAFHLAVDFHLKLPALGMVAAIFSAVAVQRVRPLRSERAPTAFWPRGVAYVTAGLVAMATATFAVPHYRAEAMREQVRREIDASAQALQASSDGAAMAESAAIRLAAATEIDPANPFAWADRSFATSLVARAQPKTLLRFGSESEIFARRALDLSPVIPESWVRLGIALDMQGRWADAGEAFTEAMRLAPARADIWFYHAYHAALRADLPEMKDIAKAQVAISLRLDPRNRDAEALRRRLTEQP